VKSKRSHRTSNELSVAHYGALLYVGGLESRQVILGAKMPKALMGSVHPQTDLLIEALKTDKGADKVSALVLKESTQ
jgi:hypothetical protein